MYKSFFKGEKKMNYILLFLGFFLLIKGADFFVDGSSNLAKVFKIPSIIIGITLVAFGTSAPEAAVSVTAALKNSTDISISNIIGSNIFNLLVVLGVTALFKDIIIDKSIVKKDYMFSITNSIILLGLIGINYILKGNLLLNRISGLILLAILIIYLINLIKGINPEDKKKIESRSFSIKDIFFIIIGLASVIIGGQLTVDSASNIARNFGFSETFIGLTIVAIGTSLPELCTSIVSLIKGENDIALGNVIGSNIFNVLFILGATSLISPIPVNFEIIIDICIMIVMSLIMLILFKDLKLKRKEGIIMILMYAAYFTYIFIR